MYGVSHAKNIAHNQHNSLISLYVFRISSTLTFQYPLHLPLLILQTTYEIDYGIKSSYHSKPPYRAYSSISTRVRGMPCCTINILININISSINLLHYPFLNNYSCLFKYWWHFIMNSKAYLSTIPFYQKASNWVNLFLYVYHKFY